jgi:hypothetical protein
MVAVEVVTLIRESCPPSASMSSCLLQAHSLAAYQQNFAGSHVEQTKLYRFANGQNFSSARINNARQVQQFVIAVEARFKRISVFVRAFSVYFFVNCRSIRDSSGESMLVKVKKRGRGVGKGVSTHSVLL